MEQIALKSHNISELSNIADKIIDFGKEDTIWLFEGDLGAGKTTLIKLLCESFGVMDLVNSPTFSIVNEYESDKGRTFYHFDFYRIKDEEEAWDIGYEEYIDSGNICFMEWPSKIPNLIPEDHLHINITIGDDESRSIVVSKVRE